MRERTCTGDEAEGIIAMLGILPKLDVAVIEDVRGGVEVVERLRRQDHAHIVSRIKQRQRLREEVWVGDLRGRSWITNLR